VVALAESARADVVCLQEAYRAESWEEHFGADWNVRSLNEFVIASRHRISDFAGLPASDAKWDPCAVRCQISTPLGTVHVVNLHTQSLRKGLEAIRYRDPAGAAILEHYTQRRNEESRQIVEWIRDANGPVILAGDFNMAAGTQAFNERWGNYLDAYSESGSGWGATFFSRWHGVRIDHVLASRDFQALDCWVMHDIGSAHRPVIASLQLVR
jgi:endonuclease/exonuclease/phosphatase family metal-dependent hydrolase